MTGTCDHCGNGFKPNAPHQRFCSSQCRSDAHNQARAVPTVEHACRECRQTFVGVAHARYCSPECRTRWRRKHRPTIYELTCAHCGTDFTAHSKPKAKPYCSDECIAAARSTADRCEHGFTSGCPACAFIDRTARPCGWRRVVRLDPCAFCGSRPANGLDHIDPRVSDRNDPGNWTGCCKRCNETKRDLPLVLVLALDWIAVSRTYHDMRRLIWPPGRGDEPLARSRDRPARQRRAPTI